MDIGPADDAWGTVRAQMQQAWSSSADSSAVNGWDRVIESLLANPQAIVHLLRLCAAEEAALILEISRMLDQADD